MFSGHLDRLHDEPAADSLAAMIRMNASVEDEGVRASVPGEVHEANQPILMISAKVA